VDSTVQMPPPSAPKKSFPLLTAKGLLQAFAEKGPWFNETSVRVALFKRLDEVTKAGTLETLGYGQRGFLIKVQVLEQSTGAGQTFYSLHNSGVAYIGTGPDADGVCAATRCYLDLAPRPEVGKKYTWGSDYYWVVPGKNGKVTAEQLDMTEFEQRARLVSLNSSLDADMRELAFNRALSDLGDRLEYLARGNAEKRRVQEYLTRRSKLTAEIEELERDLARQLERAKRAASTASTLNVIAGAFSLASAIAMSSASIGEDVQMASVKPITTLDELKAALNNVGSDATGRVQSLRARYSSLRSEKLGIEASLLDISIQFKMEPSSIPVLRVPP
jgi:hypothetical protein